MISKLQRGQEIPTAKSRIKCRVTTMREKEDKIRCARVGDDDRGGRANRSLHAWIPELAQLFFVQLCNSAVGNLKSPPDVFVVPVAFRKLSFSQIDYCWGLLM